MLLKLQKKTRSVNHQGFCIDIDTVPENKKFVILIKNIII